MLLSPNLKLIVSRTLPLTIGVFSIMFVQLVDSLFIGRLGVNALTVYGITLPFQAGFIGIQVGIGVAATSIIAQAVGAKDKNKSTQTATISLLFGGVFISLICLVFQLTNQSIFDLFVGNEQNLQQLDSLTSLFNQYWFTWLCSSIMGAMLYLTTCIFRANGDTKTTGAMFMLASVINLILDPILMFTLDMGIKGAALASLLGYVISALIILSLAFKRKWIGTLHFDHNEKAYFSELRTMAVSTTTNQLLPSISAFLGMLLIARIGTDAIAFWSVLTRIESFLLVFTLAMTMSIPPLIGQYLGEGNQDKIKSLITASCQFLLVFHVTMALFLMTFGHLIIDLVSTHKSMNAWLEFALFVMPLSYTSLGICMIVTSSYNALREANSALKTTFVRLFVLYIPAIFIGTSTNSIENTIIAVCIANFLAGIFAWVRLNKYLNAPTSFTLNK